MQTLIVFGDDCLNMSDIKSIYIFNHYAGPPSIAGGIRHYNFARYLKKEGYNVTIFAASTLHNTKQNLITGNEKYITNADEGVPFVFIKTCDYIGNGISRIRNMLGYFFGLLSVTPMFIKPDCILASSVHPLTCVAGILLARRWKIKCIVEIRDLWPETIVAIKGMSKKHPVIVALYMMEKWIYRKADSIIFTMEGGAEYIREKGWDKVIDMSKVYHINNGVDLEEFEYNRTQYRVEDEDLDNPNIFKIIYAGSIRTDNNIGKFIDVAKVLKKRGYDNIRFIIYGDGEEREYLEKRCIEEDVKNVIFKGFVNKKYIPYILSKGDINLLHYNRDGAVEVLKYGGSYNKQFDYFASGKPILSTVSANYDLISQYQCGVVVESDDPEEIAEAIISIYKSDTTTNNQMRTNLNKAAQDYNFENLTRKLINIIESP